MKPLLWQEAEKAERIRICIFYIEYIKNKENQTLTIQQLDLAWTGCWFDVIKFTFGPDSWMMK